MPALDEDRRLNRCRAGGVGVGLGGDVDAALSGTADELEHHRQVAKTGAVDVHDVQRCAGGRGVGQHLLHGIDPHRPHVGVDGRLQPSRELEETLKISSR